MSDYMVGFPLWDAGALAPSDVAVSRELRQALLDWQELFEQGFHHERGWDAASSRERYCTAGRELHRWLEAELGQVVELDLWPCEP